jgi:hypothetical protein
MDGSVSSDAPITPRRGPGGFLNVVVVIPKPMSVSPHYHELVHRETHDNFEIENQQAMIACIIIPRI